MRGLESAPVRVGATVIESARLTIRPFREDDAADLHAYLSDPAVYAFEPGEPVDLVRARAIARERAAAGDFWALEPRSVGRMVGHLSLSQVEPLAWRTWELGFIVHPAYQRRGYASEGAAALLRHAFANLAAHRVVAHCNPDNVASWRALEKAGLRREGLLRRSACLRRGADGREIWTDTFAYAMLAEDAAAGTAALRDAGGAP